MPGRTPRTAACRASRAGTPKDYPEAFGNIYTEAADAIDAAHAGHTPADVLTPGIDDGVKGLAFIEAAVASSQAGAVWVPMMGAS